MLDKFETFEIQKPQVIYGGLSQFPVYYDPD